MQYILVVLPTLGFERIFKQITHMGVIKVLSGIESV